MAVPRAKKKPNGRYYTQREWDNLRYDIIKTTFPNFIAMTLMGVMDELDHGHMKNFNLTKGEKNRLVKAIAERIDHYCDLSNQGAIDPFEVRKNFEKSTGMDFGKMWK